MRSHLLLITLFFTVANAKECSDFTDSATCTPIYQEGSTTVIDKLCGWRPEEGKCYDLGQAAGNLLMLVILIPVIVILLCVALIAYCCCCAAAAAVNTTQQPQVQYVQQPQQLQTQP